jgi:hypothetical protein
MHDCMQLPIAPVHAPMSKNPAAWDTHIFGPAYGNCNRGASPKPRPIRAAIHMGNGALFPIANNPPRLAGTPPYRKEVLGSPLDVSKLEDVRSA